MSNTCLYSISKPKNKKIRRKRATVAPYSRRNRGHSRGEGGRVGQWGPLRSPWGLPAPYPAEHTQEEAKPEKNTAQTRHSCTLFSQESSS
jgi:hypothetical protein